jgi:hypothetical protein
MVRPAVVRFLARAELLGLRTALGTAPSWLMRPAYQVVTRNPRLSLPEMPPAAALRATELTEDDIGLVLALNPAISEPEIRQRWRDGQGCLLGWRGELLAHYQWYAQRSLPLRYLDRILRLSGGDYLTGEAFTHRALRDTGFTHRPTSAICSEPVIWDSPVASGLRPGGTRPPCGSLKELASPAPGRWGTGRRASEGKRLPPEMCTWRRAGVSTSVRERAPWRRGLTRAARPG